LKVRPRSIRLFMMLQLVFAYLFAAGTGVAIVYLARQNRKQGWKRPEPKWFGVQLENREAIMPLAPDIESNPDGLLAELRQLNHELAAHGKTVNPVVASPEVESSETAELVAARKV
jgi:hypothetical protein